jgi:hypothetical protein
MWAPFSLSMLCEKQKRYHDETSQNYQTKAEPHVLPVAAVDDQAPYSDDHSQQHRREDQKRVG